jgi:hypothetical protein
MDAIRAEETACGDGFVMCHRRRMSPTPADASIARDWSFFLQTINTDASTVNTDLTWDLILRYIPLRMRERAMG